MNEFNQEFAWTPLGDTWDTKLLSKAFVVKNCFSDGNCQFRSIETALTGAGYKVTHEKLRKVIAKYINSMPMEDFWAIVDHYKIEKHSGDFVGQWDPFQVRNKRQFVNQIISSGFNFQGDNMTLSLLSRSIGIDFVILDNTYNITDLSNPDALHPKLVLLYFEQVDDMGHYQTIGLRLKNGKVTTLFSRSNLLPEIDRVIDKHSFLLQHIRDLTGACGFELKLNTIIGELQKRFNAQLTVEDKKRVMVILRNLLEHGDYIRNVKSPKRKTKSKSPKTKAQSPKRKTKTRAQSPKRKTKAQSPKIKTKTRSKSPKTKSKAQSPKIKTKTKSKSKVKRKDAPFF
jgi:hypothetical protein